MKKIISLASLVLLTVFSLQAQTAGPKMNFDSDEHDFGTIKEDKGKVTHTFTFTNMGRQPIIINNVKTSCGCTSPEYSKAPILPGAEGFIEVNYDPANRPGPFRKSITVSSNADNSPVLLYIKGNVTGKNENKEEQYLYSIGDLKIKTTHISMGNIINGESKYQEVGVYNNSDAPVSISFQNVPAHFNIQANPKTLAPGQSGAIGVQYNTQKVNDWDFVIDRVNMLQNGKVVAGGHAQLSVSAIVVEDFSGMTNEELANAPKIHYPEKTFQFGTLKPKETATYEFKVVNQGKSDLIIRKVHASCGCTAVKPEKNVLAPGESTTIKTIYTADKPGNQRKSITVISNDPVNYKSILWVKGEVVQ